MTKKVEDTDRILISYDTKRDKYGVWHKDVHGKQKSGKWVARGELENEVRNVLDILGKLKK